MIKKEKKSKIYRTFNTFLLTAGLGFFCFTHSAQAVFMSKSRLIIEENQNYAEFVILNRSDRKKLVTFGWNRRIVEKDGSFKTLKEKESVPGYEPADPYLRYSPRRAILGPGERQRIKVYARRPADLKNGEYHSHFTIISEPLREEQKKEPVKGDLVGSVNVNAGTSIPVFLRHGPSTLNVKIEDAYIYPKEGKHYLHIKASNNSTRSVYGDAVLECKKSDGQIVQDTITTLRLYTEVETLDIEAVTRDFEFKGCNDLQVKLVDRKDFEFKNKPFARAPVSVSVR